MTKHHCSCANILAREIRKPEVKLRSLILWNYRKPEVTYFTVTYVTCIWFISDAFTNDKYNRVDGYKIKQVQTMVHIIYAYSHNYIKKMKLETIRNVFIYTVESTCLLYQN